MSNPVPPTPEKRALIDAYDQALKSAAERRAEEAAIRPHRRVRPFAWLLLALAVVVIGAIAVVQPPWVPWADRFDAKPEVEDASLRLAIGLEAQRIVRFRRVHGALPERIEETGVPIPGIEYVKNGDSYLLRGTHGAAALTYRSTDSLRAFVGHSYDVLLRRGK